MVMSFIKNPLYIGILASISLNILLGLSTYYFHSKVANLQSEVRVCASFNESLAASLDRERASCKEELELVNSLVKEGELINNTLQSSLDQLMNIPPSRVPVKEDSTPPSEVVKDENTVDIDGSLPPDLIRLLDHHYRISN